MSPNKTAGNQKNETRVALIGAIATLGAALITGIFGVLQMTSRQPALPAATETAPASLASSSKSITAVTDTLPPPSPTATQIPTATPTPTPVPGLLFATRITTNGLALDPGTIFPADITDLYAVFPKGGPPPGMVIDAEDQQDGAYYAFLKVKPDSELAAFGWRWIRNGETVNEYITSVQPNSGVWLQRYDYRGEGIFNGDPLGPGSYKVH